MWNIFNGLAFLYSEQTGLVQECLFIQPMQFELE